MKRVFFISLFLCLLKISSLCWGQLTVVRWDNGKEEQFPYMCLDDLLRYAQQQGTVVSIRTGDIKLKDRHLALLKSLKSLKELAIESGSQLSHEKINELLANLPSLESLSLSHCYALRSIEGTHSLKDLEINSCPAMDSSCLAHLTQLELLSLDHCDWVNRSTIRSINNLQQIKDVTFCACNTLTDADIEVLGRLNTFSFVLKDCKKITDCTAKTLTKKLPSCCHCPVTKDTGEESWDLYDYITCYVHSIRGKGISIEGGITNEALIKILQKKFGYIFGGNAPSKDEVDTLFITDCPYLNDETILNLSRVFPNVSEVCIRNCPQLTDNTVVHLRNFTHLTQLKLNKLKISGKGLSELPITLETLDLGKCKSLDAMELVKLKDFKLNSLSLGNTNLTAEILPQLVPFRNITGLDLSGMRLTKTDLENLVKNFPNLKLLNLKMTGVTVDALKPLKAISFSEGLLGLARNNLGNEVILMLRENHSSLALIDLSHNPIDDEGALMLKNSFPNLSRVIFNDTLISARSVGVFSHLEDVLAERCHGLAPCSDAYLDLNSSYKTCLKHMTTLEKRLVENSRLSNLGYAEKDGTAVLKAREKTVEIDQAMPQRVDDDATEVSDDALRDDAFFVMLQNGYLDSTTRASLKQASRRHRKMVNASRVCLDFNKDLVPPDKLEFILSGYLNCQKLRIKEPVSHEHIRVIAEYCTTHPQLRNIELSFAPETEVKELAILGEKVNFLNLHWRTLISATDTAETKLPSEGKCNQVVQACRSCLEIKACNGLTLELSPDELGLILQNYPNCSLLKIKAIVNMEHIRSIAAHCATHPQLRNLEFKFAPEVEEINELAILRDRVTSLSFYCRNKFGATDIEYIATQSPNLTSLKLTDRILQWLVESKYFPNLPNITSLTVAGYGYNNHDLVSIAKKFPNLASLNLSRCDQNICSEAIIWLAKRLTHLTSLKVHKENMTVSELVHIATNLPRSINLIIESREITSTDLGQLEKLANLTKLHLGYSSNFEADVAAFRSVRKELGLPEVHIIR